jgi:periplasmic divalent cation tolerance protein
MAELSIVMTTLPASSGVAARISETLVSKGLVACAQGIYMHSTYMWQGDVQKAEEVLLLLKGKTENFPQIKEIIEQLHPYDLPELIQVPITDGSAGYLAYLADPLEECY